MSLSETDDEYDIFDDDIESHIDEWDFYDKNIDDSHLFESILNSVLNANEFTDIVDEPSIERLRSALDVSLDSSDNITASSTDFGDSILLYLITTSIFSSTTNLSPYFLSVNRPTTNSVLSDKIFVGNIPHSNTWQNLKTFFNSLNYDVARVDLKYNKVRRPGYAFVRFRSAEIAEKVLFSYDANPSKFLFNNIQLRIDRPKEKRKDQHLVANNINRNLENVTKSKKIELNISEVHYGTLLTPEAMKNIQTNSNYEFNFGLIAYPLIPTNNTETTIQFEIDQENRKFAFVLTDCSDYFDVWSHLKFEWSFRDLKGKKIRPVWVNDSSVCLLVELKRPPIITNICYSISLEDDFDQKVETRQPGSILLGHANAWLLPLPINNINRCKELFQWLRRYNLSPIEFTEDNIFYLINSSNSARKHLQHIYLLSNTIWFNQNEDIVTNFLQYRWPKYPFEIKFEIMKLISKHIVTINDLIVDGHLDTILSKCSINTLIACTDKIIELAPHWLQTTCDNEDDDWGNDDIDNQEEQTIHSEDLLPHTIRASTGELVDVTQTAYISLASSIEHLILETTEHHPGSLSRLLLLALDEMRRKHELRRTSIKNMFVTKQELRTINVNPFLMRKIYITPSTILHEGPYREEKCLVTRHFEKYQDRFLRVTFRDEGKIIDIVFFQ
ncbi:unnamed protein product [Rotaria sp. Silwood1]|nr:unnamed protein product [Rotaria sp. Silwood1]